MAITKEVYGSWTVLMGTEGEVATWLRDNNVTVHHCIGMTSSTTGKISVLLRR